MIAGELALGLCLARPLLFRSGLDLRHELSDGNAECRGQFEDRFHAGAVASEFEQRDVVALQAGFEGERLLRKFLALS